jgi:hypothetical protein
MKNNYSYFLIQQKRNVDRMLKVYEIEHNERYFQFLVLILDINHYQHLIKLVHFFEKIVGINLNYFPNFNFYSLRYFSPRSTVSFR